jgi:UDP-GlcNAc:undecaprenyl-phosphate GlcNAc-1-phosphate transferase
MGDTGSLLLGFLLAVLGIKLEFPGRPLGATWLIPILILGVPIFDTVLVSISRIRRGQPIYQGGTDHTSHRLVYLQNMTQARAVMTLYLAASALSLTSFMLRDATPTQARLILAALVVIAFAALIWLEWRYKTAVEESYPPFH